MQPAPISQMQPAPISQKRLRHEDFVPSDLNPQPSYVDSQEPSVKRQTTQSLAALAGEQHLLFCQNVQNGLRLSPQAGAGSEQGPFSFPRSHFQEFARQWVANPQLWQLLESTVQNTQYPARFQNYCVNHRKDIAEMTVLKHMIAYVKAELQSGPNLRRLQMIQRPDEHLEGAVGIMFSDHVHHELDWLRKNSPDYLHSIMVDAMISPNEASWRSVPLSIIYEFQDIAAQVSSSTHNSFLSKLSAQDYPKEILNVFCYLLQLAPSSEHTLLLNRVTHAIQSLHAPSPSDAIIKQFDDMEID